MNMMRNKNRNNNRNNRGGGGGRRYNNNGGGGGNRSQNDGQNLQRQKHHATQMLGKYNDLMRNAQNNGDRVEVEYYLQHIEHYTRVLADVAAVEAERFAAHRETQQSSQPQDGSQEMGEGEGAVTSEEGEQPRQPRQHRHPRRPYQQQSQHAAAPSPAEAPAPQAEATNVEIPLPGSILPPI